MSTAIAVSWATCETRCPVCPRCPSCSVCWFRALEQRQRLLHCTGSNIAHRLPAGQRTEFILSSREAQIQSLEYASGAWKWFYYFWFYLKPQWFQLAELLPGVNRSKMELNTHWSREWQKREHKWKNNLSTWSSSCGDGRRTSQSAVRPAFMLFYPSPLLQGKQANTKLTGWSLESCLHTKWW